MQGRKIKSVQDQHAEFSAMVLNKLTNRSGNIKTPVDIFEQMNPSSSVEVWFCTSIKFDPQNGTTKFTYRKKRIIRKALMVEVSFQEPPKRWSLKTAELIENLNTGWLQ